MQKKLRSGTYNSEHLLFEKQTDWVLKKQGFWPKNQYTQRKPRYFVNSMAESLSKIGHDLKK